MATGPITKDTTAIALGLAQIRVGVSATNISVATPVLTAAHSIGALASTKFTSSVDFWTLESGFPANTDMKVPLKETVEMEVSFKEITPFMLALARGIDPNSVGAGWAFSDVTKVLSAAGVVDTTKDPGTPGAGTIVDTFTITFTSATAYGVTALSGVAVGGTGAIGSASSFTIGGLAAFTIPANFITGTIASGDVFRFAVTKNGYTNNHAGTIGLGTMKAPDYVRMEALYTYPNLVNTMTIIFPRANVTSNTEVSFNASDAASPTITFTAMNSASNVAGGNAVWDNAPSGVVIFA